MENLIYNDSWYAAADGQPYGQEKKFLKNRKSYLTNI